jgi:hypothetical protein
LWVRRVRVSLSNSQVLQQAAEHIAPAYLFGMAPATVEADGFGVSDELIQKL